MFVAAGQGVQFASAGVAVPQVGLVVLDDDRNVNFLQVRHMPCDLYGNVLFDVDRDWGVDWDLHWVGDSLFDFYVNVLLDWVWDVVGNLYLVWDGFVNMDRHWTIEWDMHCHWDLWINFQFSINF